MNLNDGTSTKFKYMVLYRWVIDSIKDGSYPYSSKLPSEADLRQRFDVSRQTVRNALDRLEEEGYISRVKGSGSFVATKVKRREKKIGVMFITVGGYINSDIFNGLESVLTSHGYSIQLELSHNRVENETRFLQRMYDGHVAGLIIEGTKSNFPSPNAKLYQMLDEQGIPYVFVNSYYHNVPCNAVVWDDENIAYTLTSRLIKLGHKDIACIFRFDEMQGGRRYLGYIRALMDHGIPVNEDAICWYSTTEGSSEEVTRQNRSIDAFVDFLSTSCTALVCYNDVVASVVINKLKANSIRVPEQISVVSFDNSDLVQLFGIENFYSPSHPKEKMGRAAADMLLAQLKHDTSCENREVVIVTSDENATGDGQ